MAVRADEVDAPDDDVLELRPWRTPRWAGVVVVVAAVIGVLAVVLTRHDNPKRTPRAVVPSASPAARTIAQTAIVFRGTAMVALVDGQLVSKYLGTDHVLGAALVPPVAGTGQVSLVVDPSRALLWAVSTDSVPTIMSEYRLPGLAAVRRVVWPPVVLSAAALDGHLYVSTSVGVADLAPGRTKPLPIAGLYGAVGAVTADPKRNRIVAIDLGYPTDVWTYRPGELPRESHNQLRIGDATIAVVGDQIWIGGHQGERPTLWRLDPSTFAPVAKVPPPSGFRPRMVIVGSGTDVLWLRSSDDTDGLYCAAADTGAMLQTWRISGSVDSVAGLAYVDTAHGLQALPLAGCGG